MNKKNKSNVNKKSATNTKREKAKMFMKYKEIKNLNPPKIKNKIHLQ